MMMFRPCVSRAKCAECILLFLSHPLSGYQVFSHSDPYTTWGIMIKPETRALDVLTQIARKLNLPVDTVRRGGGALLFYVYFHVRLLHQIPRLACMSSALTWSACCRWTS